MENQGEKNLKRNYKRVAIFSAIVVMVFVSLTISYALFTDVINKNNKLTMGKLKIENRDLKVENKLTQTMQSEITVWSPGDANIITWNTVNVGTSAAKTRHTIQVYWKDSNIDDFAKELIYLYPNNMTNEEILQDFAAQKANAISVDKQATIQINNEIKKGFSYTFYGDTLNGSDNKNVATEVDYNNKNFGTTEFTTVESEVTLDKIAFRILLSPSASYLYQGNQLSVHIITEALQYTEDGTREWQIESIQDI